MSEIYKPAIETSRSEQTITRETFYQIVRQKLSYIFLNFSSGAERITEIIDGNREIIETLDNAEILKSKLASCVRFEKREQFIEAAFEILRPVADKIFENQQAAFAANPDAKVFVANEMLTYDVKGNKLFIHVFSGDRDGTINKYAQGLKKVAEALESYPQVETVEAWSWIVARHPKILERLGFIIEKDSEGKPVVFDNEQGHASIAREDFVSKYLPKK